jgi:hypothetical protein
MLARSTVVVITAFTVCVGLTACSSGSNSSAAVAVARVTDSSTPSTAASAAASSTASPSAPSPAPTTSVAAVAGGRCSMIDHPTAEAILGFSTKPGLSAAVGGTASMRKLDGCVYESLASGSLGYDVVQVTPQIGAAMLGATKARLAAGGASVSPFDPGIANSTGFTQKLPNGVDSQIWLLVGDRLISVASTRKDGDVAKSRAAAVAAAQKLAASA